MGDGMKIGKLEMQSSGRWAIRIEGEEYPDEITSGDTIEIEVSGADSLLRTGVEFSHKRRAYVSTEGYPLKDGLRVARPSDGMRF